VPYLLLYVPFVDGVLGMRYIGSMKDVVWSIPPSPPPPPRQPLQRGVRIFSSLTLLIIIQFNSTQETLETKYSVSFLITVGL
jgi:hypothetical protein